MNEYLKEYIELQKQFRETKGNPDSVRALYTFKEKLDLSEDKQAKEVLVDVYDLLDFKKDAYELLCQIGNRSDKKTLKRLGTLKEYAENWGNHYAKPDINTQPLFYSLRDNEIYLDIGNEEKIYNAFEVVCQWMDKILIPKMNFVLPSNVEVMAEKERGHP